MKRRDFLRGSGLAVGFGSLAGCAAGPVSLTRTSPPRTWREAKASFELDPDFVQMAGFYLAPHPAPVREAVAAHRRGLDANPIGYMHEQVGTQERRLRAALAEYFEADGDDFAITDSTTMGLGLVYGGLHLEEGQELLSTTHDHIATTGSLHYRAQRTGAPFRQEPLYGDPAAADADAIAEAFERALSPRTRIVAVTWVHSGTGVKLPIARLAEVLRRFNEHRDEHDRALLCVDGVHGLGIEDETPAGLGCDFLVAGTHKWMFGPRGTGLVWAHPGAWPVTTPTIPTFEPIWRDLDTMPPAAFMTPGGFQAYEHRWATEPAFRFHLGLGKARVAARIHELNRQCKEGLAAIPGVRVRTPRSDDLSAGIICLEVEGKEPPHVVAELHRHGIVASVTPDFYETPYVRLAPGLLTLEEDVDRALAAVRSVA